MGLGGAPGEHADYEWLRLADWTPPERPAAALRAVAADAPAPVAPVSSEELAERMRLWAREHSCWVAGDERERFLLIDLDNIRAFPGRLQARIELLKVVAESADHVVAAGQHAAVARGTPWLGDLMATTYGVDAGADLADHVLLEEARDLSDGGPAQFVVVSNDGIFGDLAVRGPITVLSPGLGALSERLRRVAARVVDLTEVESGLAGAPTPPAARTASPARRVPARQAARQGSRQRRTRRR